MVLSLLITSGAFPAQMNPLGIILRPGVVGKFIEVFNARKRPVQFQFCIDNNYFDLNLGGNISKFEWKADKNAFVDLNIQQFKAEGRHLRGCEVLPGPDKVIRLTAPVEAKASSIAVLLGPSTIGLSLDPRSMTVNVEPSTLSAAVSQFIISIPEAPMLAKELNSEALKESIFWGLASELTKLLSAYLTSTLRGLSYIEFAGQLLSDNPLFNEGPILKKGGIQIELAAPHPKQKFLTLSFMPFKTPAAFVRPEGFELYFNANIFTFDEVSFLTGLNPLEEKSQAVLNRAQSFLLDPSQQALPQFDRPAIKSVPADLSLIIPTSLIDEALSQIYRERLLSFRLTTDIGRLTKGVIANQNLDVGLAITISPQSTPQIKFSANTFQLEVKDYFMDIGTEIEDRLIPSTQIANAIRVAASMRVDADHKTVNMVLNPNAFEIQIEDTKKRLSENDLSFLKKIAVSTWTEFLKSYSEFVLFPTVINPKDLQFEIRNISLQGNFVLLDLNLISQEASSK